MLNIDFLNNDYADTRTPAEKAGENIKIAILNREIKPGQRLIENNMWNSFPTEGLLQPISTAGCWMTSFP